MFSIRHQSCPNRRCQFYCQSMQGNVVIHSRKFERLKCNACNKTWVAHRNEVRYGLRSDLAKVQAVIEMFKAEMSIRKIAYEIEVSASTVQRWKKRFKNTIH